MRSLKSYLLICLTFLLTSLLFSCSKSKDNPALPDGKTMKFTINTPGLLATDDFDMVFTGGDVQGAAMTIFKVNGVTQSNQRAIIISNAQLRAGQIVIETVVPLYTVAISVGGSSATNGHTFTFKMEPVVNNVAQPVVNKTITTTAYSENFSF